VEGPRVRGELMYVDESNRETDKVEAFADDTSVITKLCQQSITTLKIKLRDFGELSGLKCNLEKSVIMPIGGADPNDVNIVESGFLVDNHITVLGLKIYGDLSNMDACHFKSIEKM